MTVEVIQALGQWIITPICVVAFFYLIVREMR